MKRTHRFFSGAGFFLALLFILPAGAETYRIRDIFYDIDGVTREYPLAKNLEIERDRDRVFPDRTSLESYVRDLEVRLLNQRVLADGSVRAVYGQAEEDGSVPADLYIRAKDTVNIIAVPYPKFDSNDGLNLKLKFKDYNFFGSMNELNLDFEYEYDPNDAETPNTVGGNASFEIPFLLFGEEFTWSVDFGTSLPIGEPTEVDFTTTLDYERKLIPNRLDIHAGVTQEVYVNPRDDEENLYPDDPLYFGNCLYVNLPVILYRHDYFGNLTWTPEISYTNHWAPGGITDDDLRGMSITFSHTAAYGRYDWVENFRRGFDLEASNGWTYNFTTKEKNITVNATATGYTPLFSFLGLSARGYFMYDWESDGDLQVDMGSYMRGIIDNRIDTDAAFFFNLDLPFRILDVDFLRTTGINWTKYVNFELHISPFFDFGLTHDQYTGRYFSFRDAWYSGGLEMIVYPDVMRSIYARVSAGFDLRELFGNGFDFGAEAEREGGGSIMEIFIGVGLEY